MDKENARKKLEDEWDYVLKHPNIDFLNLATCREQISQINAVIHGSELTYKYILLTAALAKAVNPNIHYRALQQGSKLVGAYDARSLAHSVVVPFEKSHGERLGGSNEPFLNRPARYPEFDLSNRDRSRRAQLRLYSLLDNSQVNSSRDTTLPTAFLRQVLKEFASLQPTVKEFQIPPVEISFQTVVRIVNEFLQVSGSGERLVALCAATFASMHNIFGEKVTVKVYPVNWPDRFAKTAGDIEFYLGGKLIKAAESKDKPISESDVRHCQMKAKRHNLTEYIVLDGAGIVQGDKQAIDKFIESELKEGINIYIMEVPEQLFSFLLYFGEPGRRVFLNNVGKYLNEIRARDDNKEAWQQLIDKHFSKV